MTTQANTTTSMIWPTAVAGALGVIVMVFAVLVAGPADAASVAEEVRAVQSI